MQSVQSRRFKFYSMLAAALVLSVMFALPASANVKPGDIITAQNAPEVKDLVAPGVYYKVVNGMSMKIVPTSRVDWPPPYKDATEKYADQVRLSPDGRSLANYVAGQPFPFLDRREAGQHENHEVMSTIESNFPRATWRYSRARNRDGRNSLLMSEFLLATFKSDGYEYIA